MLLGSIWDLGRCPCPQCLVLKEDIGKLGTPRDRATRLQKRFDDDTWRFNVKATRRIIYIDGYVVNSDAVDALLKDYSMTLTEVCFSYDAVQGAFC